MSHAALKEKLADFQSALAQLHEALSKDIQSDSMYLDATIQRFEFTYELCWKLMKAYLDYLGVEVNNPRAAIRESMKQKMIQDTPLWMAMIEKRNLTTHTYHQELAIEVYHAIQSHFIRLLRDFDKKIAPLVRAIKAK